MKVTQDWSVLYLGGIVSAVTDTVDNGLKPVVSTESSILGNMLNLFVVYFKYFTFYWAQISRRLTPGLTQSSPPLLYNKGGGEPMVKPEVWHPEMWALNLEWMNSGNQRCQMAEITT
jgi:hypothetical protein